MLYLLNSSTLPHEVPLFVRLNASNLPSCKELQATDNRKSVLGTPKNILPIFLGYSVRWSSTATRSIPTRLFYHDEDQCHLSLALEGHPNAPCHIPLLENEAVLVGLSLGHLGAVHLAGYLRQKHNSNEAPIQPVTFQHRSRPSRSAFIRS